MADEWKRLFTAAANARKKSHSPYSNFAVGAALLLDDGSIAGGCNVENASYGLTVCAERSAIGAMVLAGRKPICCAILVDSAVPTPPCGMCRQVLAEFAGPEFAVRSRTLQGDEEAYTLGELLPHMFTRSFLSLRPPRASRLRARR